MAFKDLVGQLLTDHKDPVPALLMDGIWFAWTLSQAYSCPPSTFRVLSCWGPWSLCVGHINSRLMSLLKCASSQVELTCSQ